MQLSRLFQKLLFVSLFLFSSLAFAWQQLPGSAREVAIGGKNKLWAIGTDAQDGGSGIYQWLGSRWSKIDGAGVSIAVDRFGRPWVVNNRGQIFIRRLNQWSRIEGDARQIAIGGVDEAWMLGRDPAPGGFSIYKRWEGRWVRVEGGAVRIAVDRNGSPWVVNNKQEIFRFSNGRWIQLPGAARDIAAGGGAIWVVGTNPQDGGFGVFSWNGRDWEPVEGGARRIAVDNFGNPVVVNSNADIFKLG